MKKKKISFTSVGGNSILTIFAVLCFIIFALLSLSTSKADSMLAQKSTDAVKKYYEADTRAEKILAKIRQGNVPDGVVKKGNNYSYTCPLDDTQQISVQIEKRGSEYIVKKWKKEYNGKWKADESIKVWEGMQEIDQ